METNGLDNFWSLPLASVYDELSCGPGGLSAAEAKRRLLVYGANTLRFNPARSRWLLFLSQFRSPVTLLLIVAALLSAGLGDAADTIIILVIVLISSLLGYFQEKGAADAVNELLKLVRVHCTVTRDGEFCDIAVEDAVPGDIVHLAAGDLVPGDCLIVESSELFTDEAAFTGETFPVEKRCGEVPAGSSLSGRANVLFMGSHIISGTATALIVMTGPGTEFGHISAGLTRQAAETEFEQGIRRFGYMLMEITLLLVLVIFAINVLLHKPVLDSFLFSLALAVGLTPQLLPAIISVNLSAGARRMAKKQVIVKRLSSIENLGSLDILCSDKTGTITQGKVTLEGCYDAAGKKSNKIMEYACLNASLQQGYTNPIDEALILAGGAASGDYQRLAEIPYDFSRKRLTVLVGNGDTGLAITKGAFLNVLDCCDHIVQDGNVLSIDAVKKQVLQQYAKFSAAGLRTLALSYKVTGLTPEFTKDDECGMVFAGFITLFDPPKEGIGETIGDLGLLGVTLKLITGDNELVARSLALQIGMKDPRILTGEQLRLMSNTALQHQAVVTDIFAAVEPNQKERIIMLLKKAGHVVGFMGDGINDAPALHAADVGISVNTAVDVAKEAADIVLLSQDLQVLADGITEGRKTFANTMKYIFMATSANFGNMFSMAGASLFLPFLPLLPKQVLLTNLMTDFPEMAIATDRVDAVNIGAPQRWDMRFIRRFMILFGLLSSVFDYCTFAVLLLILHANEKTFQTGWFTESVISAILIVLIIRTRLPFFRSLPGRYLALATIMVLLAILFVPVSPAAAWFGFVPLSLAYYGYMLLIIVAYLFCAEILKQWFYRRLSRVGARKNNRVISPLNF